MFRLVPPKPRAQRGEIILVSSMKAVVSEIAPKNNVSASFQCSGIAESAPNLNVVAEIQCASSNASRGIL
jgi:hypothetical protein